MSGQVTYRRAAHDAPTLDPDHFRYERYRRTTGPSRLRDAYYALKPLMPRAIQLALRRGYAPLQARRRFPAWPIEPVLIEQQHAEFRRRLGCATEAGVPFVNFWPDGKRFAVVLTHDVEGPAGVDNVRRVIEVERRHGFVSSWNFVAESYPVPDDLLADVRAAGCEVGLHGIKHDGKLFRDRPSFERNLPKIRRYLAEMEAVGFRSPATYRNADWMAELPVLYDSSFPDTDPFEPQPGGCCSIFPFFFGDVVELPITLVQDHTLWEILRDRSIARWVQKSEWIIGHHGLINLIVHPDYVVRQDRLDLYEQFLAYLAGLADGWHALPRDVALWWRQRDALSVVESDGEASIAGSSDQHPTVAYARERDGTIVFDV